VWLIFSSFANNFVSSMDYCDQVKAELVETGVVIEEGKESDFKDACSCTWKGQNLAMAPCRCNKQPCSFLEHRQSAQDPLR
jgi:hypothetical protein